MRRAPVVLAGTVFGTAAVLGLHARQPAATVNTATASESSGSTSARTTSAAKVATTRTRSALGAAMSTRYGPAQVRVTVSNGKIVKVEVVQIQNADPKSQAIVSYAVPMLNQSVLSKQTAAVDSVSGATYTSLSYEASLQSALDKLGYKAPNGTRASTDVSQLQ